MTLLARVHRLLVEQRVAHALIGAGALAAHGIARSTYDIDLLTTDTRVLDPALWDAWPGSPVEIDIRRGDADDPLGGVVRLETAADRPVDVVLGRHAWQTRAVERASQVPGGPPIVSAHDLILLKLYAGGHQDLWDVRELLRLPGADRLIADVDAELAGLPGSMRERWAEARR